MPRSMLISRRKPGLVENDQYTNQAAAAAATPTMTSTCQSPERNQLGPSQISTASIKQDHPSQSIISANPHVNIFQSLLSMSQATHRAQMAITTRESPASSSDEDEPSLSDDHFKLRDIHHHHHHHHHNHQTPATSNIMPVGQQLSSPSTSPSLLAAAAAAAAATAAAQDSLGHQHQEAPIDSQVDTLTNAILYFVTLFNQQQQQQQQQQQPIEPSIQSVASIDQSAIFTPSSGPPRGAQSLLSPPGSSGTSLMINGKLPARVKHTPAGATSRRRSKNQHNQHQRGNQSKKRSQVVVPVAPTKLLLEDQQQHLSEHHHDDQRLQPDTNLTSSVSLANHDEVNEDSQGVPDTPGSLQLLSSSASDSGKRSSSGSGTGDNFVHYCHDCGKRYSTSSNLARHRQTHRDVTDKKAKKCPECDKIYVSMPAFSMHLRTHNQGCICSICGKSFSRPWLLQGHMRTHTGEKPFRCKICDKAFADKSNLRAHIQTHSTTKPHVCERCNKAFALKSYLCKHVESTCMRAIPNTPGGGALSQKEPLNLKVMNHLRRGQRSSSNQ